MCEPRLVLAALPADVLDEIAYHTAVLDLLGPPHHLVALLCTCKRIYAVLCSQNNHHLYARIFVAKFDHRAARRRMGVKAGHASALASQLTRYCKAIRNIRSGDIYSPSITKDFLRAYALCLENDGKNAAQLRWAGLFEFAEQFILERLWEGRDTLQGWPVEDIDNSLALWLYWYSSSEDHFASKTREERDMFMELLRPYALYNFRYPPFFAPDNHAHLPLYGTPDAYRDHSTVTPHGFYPLYRDPALCTHTMRHYGRTLALAEPPLGLVAKLLYVALQEYNPVDTELLIPVDRDEAALLHTRGPTRADYAEFARTKAVRHPAPGDWRAAALLRARDRSPSMASDNDWERWYGCHNPWAPSPSHRAKYTFGSLTGLWGGRSLDPEILEYEYATNTRDFDADLVERAALNVPEHPLFFTLREHRARPGPAAALPHWQVHGRDPLNEGIMNAYLPRGWAGGFLATERAGALRIFQVGRGRQWVYETYAPGGKRGADDAGGGADAEMMDVDVDADAEERIGRARAQVQRALGDGMDVDELLESVASGSGSGSGPSRSRSRSHSTDSSGSSSGASDSDEPPRPRGAPPLDIILTGSTETRHALAWGNYHLYGRVRAWDGLIVLVRAPAPEPDVLSPFPERLEPYVFRGYLLGGANLVGAWRHVTDSVHTIPVEGPFVVSRVAVPPVAAVAVEGGAQAA
ncbi:hypothetical protein C2E23DRAFT_906734 [Lenzites betulinus]|nr:hypothetical protein C2E23DRAFT_906734 [Lenzites betulinus]